MTWRVAMAGNQKALLPIKQIRPKLPDGRQDTWPSFGVFSPGFCPQRPRPPRRLGNFGENARFFFDLGIVITNNGRLLGAADGVAGHCSYLAVLAQPGCRTDFRVQLLPDAAHERLGNPAHVREQMVAQVSKLVSAIWTAHFLSPLLRRSPCLWFAPRAKRRASERAPCRTSATICLSFARRAALTR